jgi:hypothetical protein
MTPLAALPDYHFLPAPLWLLTALHVLTLTLHFAAMNLLFGGLVVVLFGRFEGKWRHPVVRTYASLFPVLMAATVTLGVAPLLFVQLVYGGSVYSAAIVSGWLWLAIPLVVMIAYYFLYAGRFAKEGSPRTRTWMGLAFVGLLFVSLVYSSVFSLSEHPQLQKDLYAKTQSGLLLNPHVGDWLFRWLHMLTGATAVGAFFAAVLVRKDEKAFKVARSFFLGGMIAAMAAGIVYLLSLGDLIKPFMHSSGIVFMTVGILLALGSLHMIFKRKFFLTGGMLFVSLLTMVATRHVVRNLALAGSFDASALPVAPQWGVFAIFVVCLVAAIALVAWMLKLYFRSGEATA